MRRHTAAARSNWSSCCAAAAPKSAHRDWLPRTVEPRTLRTLTLRPWRPTTPVSSTAPRASMGSVTSKAYCSCSQEGRKIYSTSAVGVVKVGSALKLGNVIRGSSFQTLCLPACRARVSLTIRSEQNTHKVRRSGPNDVTSTSGSSGHKCTRQTGDGGHLSSSGATPGLYG